MFFSVKKWDCVVSWMFGREGDQNLQDCAICKNALTEPSVTYETDPCPTVRRVDGVYLASRARTLPLSRHVPRCASLHASRSSDLPNPATCARPCLRSTPMARSSRLGRATTDTTWTASSSGAGRGRTSVQSAAPLGTPRRSTSSSPEVVRTTPQCHRERERERDKTRQGATGPQTRSPNRSVSARTLRAEQLRDLLDLRDAAPQRRGLLRRGRRR